MNYTQILYDLNCKLFYAKSDFLKKRQEWNEIRKKYVSGDTEYTQIYLTEKDCLVGEAETFVKRIETLMDKIYDRNSRVYEKQIEVMSK